MRRMAIFFCLVVLLFCGCSNGNVWGNVTEGQIVSADEREEKIEDAIENIDGVYSATAVIRGNAVLIGLVIERGYEKENTEIKSMAATTARLTDKTIKSTAVTCNAEITEMIKNLKNITR